MRLEAASSMSCLHPPMSNRTGDSTFNHTELVRALERLTSLMNEDPPAALEAAREIRDKGANWLQLRATILCDAGAAARDVASVAEATDVFSRLHGRFPDNGGLAYNLANALVVQAKLDGTPTPDWYLHTADRRSRARVLYGQAANCLGHDDPALASQAMTNLGNSLDGAHRWIEAFEAYQEALKIYPQNGVASGCAARVLFRVSSTAILGHKPHLIDVALRLAHHAKSNRETVVRFAGTQAARRFERLRSKAGGIARQELGKRPSAYERFVAENRLLLSPIMEGLGHDRRRWDDAHIRGITEETSAGAQVPPLFAMFNVMKADYLVARELLFQGLSKARGAPPDTGLYFDTLDYAVYGAAPSRLVLAQRAALDLLDKIAVALNDLLSVGEKPPDVSFRRFWREKPKQPRWRPALAKAIHGGNPALIALAEIATDLSTGSQEGSLPGLLHAEARARNAGTHRFIVLHDIAPGDPRPSAAIEHHRLEVFRGTGIRTVRLARAALLHFLEVVAYVERSRPQGGPIESMPVLQPHHVVRGHD